MSLSVKAYVMHKKRLCRYKLSCMVAEDCNQRIYEEGDSFIFDLCAKSLSACNFVGFGCHTEKSFCLNCKQLGS